jgi:hypothetical protein
LSGCPSSGKTGVRSGGEARLENCGVSVLREYKSVGRLLHVGPAAKRVKKGKVEEEKKC